MTAYQSYESTTANPCREHFESTFIGEYETPADFAEHLLELTGELQKIPQFLRDYIDFEGFGESRLRAGSIRREGRFWFWEQEG
jgi:antirestriction protein